MTDSSGYPTTEDLTSILTYEGPVAGFLELVASIWPSHGHIGEQDVDGASTPMVQYRLTTGGWSGCEDVIGAIGKTMFQVMYWHSDTRGGAHTYRVPRTHLESSSWDLVALAQAQEELEWGVRHSAGEVLVCESETQAREATAEGSELVVRWVTPWQAADA